MLLKRKTTIAAKDESSEGTPFAITSTEAKYIVENVSYKLDTTVVTRNIGGYSFARKQSITTQENVTISFRTEIVGSGTVDVEPAWALFLKGCGFKATTNAAASVQYDPVTNATYGLSNGNVTLTIWVYLDGKVKKAKGCRGTFKISAEAGQIGFIDWEFKGVYDNVVDGAFPVLGAGFDSNIPPIVESCTFQFQGLASGTTIVKNIGIDIGNVITPRYDVTSSNGIRNYFVSDRVIKGTIDPEDMLESEWGADGGAEKRLSSGKVGTFSVVIGATTGNKFQITCPAQLCQIESATEGERDTLAIHDVTLGFFTPVQESATDKEIRFLTL